MQCNLEVISPEQVIEVHQMVTQEHVARSSQCLYIFSLIHQTVHISTQKFNWQNCICYYIYSVPGKEESQLNATIMVYW